MTDTAVGGSSAEPQKAIRLSITISPTTRDRLRQARKKRGVQINVSHLADAAINKELDRLENLGVAEVVERLRVERYHRRGEPFTLGYREGQRWAKDVASWIELSKYASFTSSDIVIVRGPGKVSFGDAFQAPKDYGKDDGSSMTAKAPAFRAPSGVVRDLDLCFRYWWGWLTGVSEIFAAVKSELPPIGDVNDDVDAVEQLP